MKEIIPEEAESTKRTKEWWRRKIEEQVELLDREEQLEKGELI